MLASSAETPLFGWADRGCRAAHRAAEVSGRAARCLRDEESLLLAAGEPSDRPVRVGARTDERDHLLDALASLAAPRERQPSPIAVEPEPDEIDAANPRRGVETVTLRQVADLVVSLARPRSEHRGGASC